jgi:hypothetical protein
MSAVPSFTSLRRNFPYKPLAASPTTVGAVPGTALRAGNRALVEKIGGDLHRALSAIYPDLEQMNTCAVRLSYCLNAAGAKLRPARGVRMKQGADGGLYAFSADEMITYLKETFGKGVLVWDGTKGEGKRAVGKLKETAQGILGYDWQGRIADFGATGHVDIGQIAGGDVGQIGQIGTGAYFATGAMKVFFWPAPA